MLEDTVLTQFYLEPMEPERIVWAEDGEIAYTLKTINHGEIHNYAEEMQRLEAITPVSANTLGFELDTGCDFIPDVLKTFTADKKKNAEYNWGEHAPGGKRHQEPCRFKPGDKVLCLMYGGYDAVFPGIVVSQLSAEYLRELYETDETCQDGYESADDMIERWADWDWDSIIVRPLVRLKSDCWDEEMGNTLMVNRVYVFPYKKFEI